MGGPARCRPFDLRGAATLYEAVKRLHAAMEHRNVRAPTLQGPVAFANSPAPLDESTQTGGQTMIRFVATAALAAGAAANQHVEVAAAGLAAAAK